MSDFSDLSVGLSGLEAQQMGLDTVGQNVANANTPGYVDEKVNLGAVGTAQHLGFDNPTNPGPGDGVAVVGINRLSNGFLQTLSYNEQAAQGKLTAQNQGLQSVQANFPEPSTNGISSQLTSFWQDWSTLANNPSDQATRQVLVNDAGSLTSSLNQTYSSLSSLSRQTAQDIGTTLTQVNQTASQIAALNQEILAGSASATALTGNANSSGSVAALQDQRDQLVSNLSGQLGVRVNTNSDGTINVYAGSEPLVQGSTSQSVALSSSGPPYSLVWSGDQSTFQPTTGQVAGMLDVVNSYVPQYQQGLDSVAHSLMGSVNNMMSQGYDLNGNKGVPFFLGTGASDIGVNPAVTADPSTIAAAATTPPAGSTATNNDGTIAADIGEMPNSQTVAMAEPAAGWSAGGTASSWTGAPTSTGAEADVAYNQLVTNVAQATSSVSNQLSSQQAVTTNVNSALQSATGVNMDEEMTNMVMYQNAYDASAKFITTVNATLQTLITMVG